MRLAQPGPEAGLLWRHAPVPRVLSHLSGFYFYAALAGCLHDLPRALGEERQQRSVLLLLLGSAVFFAMGNKCIHPMHPKPRFLGVCSCFPMAVLEPSGSTRGSAARGMPVEAQGPPSSPFSCSAFSLGDIPWQCIPPPASCRGCFLSSFFFSFKLSWPMPSVVPDVAVGESTASPAHPTDPGAGSAAQCIALGLCHWHGGRRSPAWWPHGCSSAAPVQNGACPIAAFPTEFPFSAGARSFSATVTSVGTTTGARCHQFGPRYQPAASHPSITASGACYLSPSSHLRRKQGNALVSRDKSRPPSVASSPGCRVIARQSPCSYCRCFGKHVCREADTSSAQNRRKVTERSPEDSPKPENPAGI